MATLRAAQIKPGTTPLLDITVDGQDLSNSTVYVTIHMSGRTLIKTNRYDDGDIAMEVVRSGDEVDTLLTVQYSQADTLYLRPGNASIEISWINEDGTADKTDLARLFIPKTLYREVMAYGRHPSEDIE